MPMARPWNESGSAVGKAVIARAQTPILCLGKRVSVPLNSVPNLVFVLIGSMVGNCVKR
jgi:hypothetical protein